ncbi:MAG: hypothetical protein A2293_14335 [Elusimicrobia bacterium RIFOXYB2_FULL_49_7]|nr:MAG: hypothetical protein A2293_14335 [Elusimicrobia bacterium RIFOXYB2_FULL_49_7]
MYGVAMTRSKSSGVTQQTYRHGESRIVLDNSYAEVLATTGVVFAAASSTGDIFLSLSLSDTQLGTEK